MGAIESDGGSPKPPVGVGFDFAEDRPTGPTPKGASRPTERTHPAPAEASAVEPAIESPPWAFPSPLVARPPREQAPRIIRLRHLDEAGVADRRPRGPNPPAARQLVQVFNGGSMGTGADIWYLGYPVELDGTEAEGGAASSAPDTNRVVPFVLIGSGQASVGDQLPVFAVGGRWVGELGNPSDNYTCSPCAIPQQDLTISWVNVLEGNGSDTLVYGSGPTWATGCSGGEGIGNQIIFKLFCTGGQVELRVYYFVSGSCPTGQSNYCSNLRDAGSKLTLALYVCGSGFTFVFTCNSESSSCPILAASGFTQVTVTL